MAAAAQRVVLSVAHWPSQASATRRMELNATDLIMNPDSTDYHTTLSQLLTRHYTTQQIQEWIQSRLARKGDVFDMYWVTVQSGSHTFTSEHSGGARVRDVVLAATNHAGRGSARTAAASRAPTASRTPTDAEQIRDVVTSIRFLTGEYPDDPSNNKHKKSAGSAATNVPSTSGTPTTMLSKQTSDGLRRLWDRAVNTRNYRAYRRIPFDEIRFTDVGVRALSILFNTFRRERDKKRKTRISESLMALLTHHAIQSSAFYDFQTSAGTATSDQPENWTKKIDNEMEKIAKDTWDYQRHNNPAYKEWKADNGLEYFNFLHIIPNGTPDGDWMPELMELVKNESALGSARYSPATQNALMDFLVKWARKSRPAPASADHVDAKHSTRPPQQASSQTEQKTGREREVKSSVTDYSNTSEAKDLSDEALAAIVFAQYRELFSWLDRDVLLSDEARPVLEVARQAITRNGVLGRLTWDVSDSKELTALGQSMRAGDVGTHLPDELLRLQSRRSKVPPPPPVTSPSGAFGSKVKRGKPMKAKGSRGHKRC